VTDQLAAAMKRDQRARITFRNQAAAAQDLARLAAAQRARNQWVDRHQEENSRWFQMEGVLRRYEYRLGRAATRTRPACGPVPGHLTGRVIRDGPRPPTRRDLDRHRKRFVIREWRPSGGTIAR
jgi:hypothetical protein